MLLDRREIERAYSELTPPWGPIGYVTFKRTYARRVQDSKRPRTEEWWETLLRVVNGFQQLGVGYSRGEMRRLYDHLFWMRAFTSGRSMWWMGTDQSMRYADGAVNCWFKRINTIDSFCFLFAELMLGGGVGFSVRAEDVSNLPPVVAHPVEIARVDSPYAAYIVPDSREGWIELLRKTLAAFLLTGKGFSYSLHAVRPKGAPINGFGGVAAGPDVLARMVREIATILNERRGLPLRSLDVLDICNTIGACVVAGNVRRSAQIGLGDCSDLKFLQAKRWDKGRVPACRSYSNNTVYCDSLSGLPAEYWEPFTEKFHNPITQESSSVGEVTGLFNLANCRKYGRMGEESPDLLVAGVNPCGEEPLEDSEPCNLFEGVPANCQSREQLLDAVLLLYRAAKHICAHNYLHEATNEVVHRNFRMGCSMTGLLQDTPLARSPKQLITEVLPWVYRELDLYDRQYSSDNDFPISKRRTTVEPSGTKSLLAGVLSGLHGAYAEFWIKNMRVSASEEALVRECRRCGYRVEPLLVPGPTGGLVEDPDTVVVSFPVAAPKGARLASDMSALDQLESLVLLQKHWADGSASCTITYQEHEVPGIRSWLAERYGELKSVCFAPYSNHGFTQAPVVPLTREQYDAEQSLVRPIVRVSGDTMTEVLDKECVGGSCPVR